MPLLKSALECKNPIHSYHRPPLPLVHPPPIIHHTNYLSLETKITTWNITSINTSIPCLYTFIQQNKPAILLLQETKLTTKKPPKYLQNLFPNYRLIFNNTNKITQRQECQIDQFYRIKTWHNHQISKSKIQCYINNNPIQVTKNEDIEYKIKIKIKIKCLRITYQIQYTKTYYYSFDNSLILLRSEDIEVNPGPMPNILETHPLLHR